MKGEKLKECISKLMAMIIIIPSEFKFNTELMYIQL
jgi:hypothetical protein